MKFISFGIFSKYLIIPFLVPIFYSVREIAFKALHNSDIAKYPLLVSTVMFFREIMCGILMFFSCWDRPKFEEEHYLYNNELIHDTITEEEYKYIPRSIKVYLLIDLCAFIDFLGYTITSCFCAYPDIQNNNIHIETRIIPIFFMGILSWKFLKFSIYLHHIVSSVVIGCGFILISIDRFPRIITLNPLLIFLIFTVIKFIYSIKQIIDKILIDKKFISPFLLLFLQGCFGFFYCLISYGIAQFIRCPSGINYCKEGEIFEKILAFNIVFENSNNILFLSILFVSSIGLNVFLMLTKKYFTPTHRSLSDTLTAFVSWIILIIVPGNTEWARNAMNIPGYLLIFVGCLVFSEIIILHFCKLDRDTKEQITKRAATFVENEIISNVEKVDIQNM